MLAAAVGLAALLAPAAAAAVYAGRDTAPGTGWRATAEQQIQELRTAPLSFDIRRPDGSVATGAQVHVQMQRHAFAFGSAVNPELLVQAHPNYDQTYKVKVKQLFNTAVYENHHKWNKWANPGEQQEAMDGLGALERQGLDSRGHAMLWTRHKSVPENIQQLLDAPAPSQNQLQQLYDATFDHVADIGGSLSGRIAAWDVLNEPRTSFDIEEKLIGFTPSNGPIITGRGDLRARWFTAAQSADPHALLMLNDFGILPGAGLADHQPGQLKEQLNDMLAHGAPVGGLGFQSHFSDDTATNKAPVGAQAVWDVLDAFADDYDLPVHITEFDFDTADRTLQADYTRDFMTAIFAHASVEAFVLWDFYEGQALNPDTALYDLDWNLKPNGRAFRDLVFKDWWTDEAGELDALGNFAVTGFKGDYRVEVTVDGETLTFDGLTLGDHGLTRVLVVPEPAAGLLLAGTLLLVSRRRLRAG